ncbi:uncharacterized protein LOC142325758 [Lycorma delicatula]|uniref:uncharacterized protein LOC142325758 n=1 Tax=Lycorma delicatula TaxID=130591 RepID=UPI003F51A752
MKYKMGAEIADHYTQNKQSSLLSREVADIITDIFGKILWNIVSSPYVQHALETGYPPIYYEEFLQNKENDKRIAKCPLDVTRQIFSNIISQLVSECFIRYLP